MIYDLALRQSTLFSSFLPPHARRNFCLSIGVQNAFENVFEKKCKACMPLTQNITSL